MQGSRMRAPVDGSGSTSNPTYASPRWRRFQRHRRGRVMSGFREYPGAFDEAVDDEIRRERARRGGGNGRNGDGSGGEGGQQTNEQWPEPKPLPAGLAPVAPLKSEVFPEALTPWLG